MDFQRRSFIRGEVADILQKTAEALPVLNSAFEKPFAHLMQGELLDIEADIELLKSTLNNGGGK